jgi:hypothetical protein
MTGVAVADGAQVLVVAADKGGTTPHTAGKLQNCPVNLVAEPDHGFGLIKILPGKKLGRASAENILGGNQDFTCVFSTSGKVEQAEQDSLRPHAQEFVEVSCHAQVIVHSPERGTAQRGHVGVSRIDTRRRHFGSLEQQARSIGGAFSTRTSSVLRVISLA